MPSKITQMSMILKLFDDKQQPLPKVLFSTSNGWVADFTDTGISKFNGQVQERELEPWEGGTDGDSSSSLLGVETGGPVGPLAPLGTLTSAGGGGGQQNGWDVNEMFRTNAEKYGVTSTYDDNLIGYTVQLEKKNTPEYQRRELEAIKVANEINNSAASKNRLQLENGDDDKSSAVVRPTPQDNR
ncbi:ATXN2 [Cordylochernes scorpioides]|uniref:ATXN2 n=1 Tax=Cordylochernes scorpioides TaxID=51811 RepID=A0ABY6JYG3_9ARAC|nr:ATXN2 [Cordylochernes scorpioides]